jgi:hypothetical protein
MKTLLASFALASATFFDRSPIAVPVTADNFTRAESDKYFAEVVKDAGGLGRFRHRREMMSIEKQGVIRGNRDTLYHRRSSISTRGR